MTRKNMCHLILQIILLAGLVGQNRASAIARDSVIVKINNSTIILYGKDSKELKEVLKYDLNAIFADLLKEFDKDSSNRIFVQKELEKIAYKVQSDSIIVQQDTMIVAKDFEKRKKVFQKGSPREGLNIYLGLNAFSKNDPRGYESFDYELRPLGSRFIALSAVESVRLTKGTKSDLFLDFGLDVAWYNLMFGNNNTVIKLNDELLFSPHLNDDGTIKQLSKSKLTVPTINLSLMPTIAFHKSVVKFISAGVYGGYRLGGYTKTKTPDRKKEHVRDNYYLNDFRYGLALEIGFKKFPDLFFKYDLNELFKNDKGPDLQMISFGIRL